MAMSYVKVGVKANKVRVPVRVRDMQSKQWVYDTHYLHNAYSCIPLLF